MSQLFCESIASGELPSDWKLDDIVPLFKKGSKQSPSNYRPVSLTAVPCKVLESIIRDRIMDHMESTRQLHDAQHGGALVQHSCCLHLMTGAERSSEETRLTPSTSTSPGPLIQCHITDFCASSKLMAWGQATELDRVFSYWLPVRKHSIQFSNWQEAKSCTERY